MNIQKLEKQIERFINSGFKKSKFTNDIYEMLHVRSNRFIAHFNKDGFHAVRFACNVENTIDQLRAVSKPEIKKLCVKLADAMEEAKEIRIETTFSYTVVKNK